MIENNDSVNFYKEAFFQSINHREKVISNIDNQINGLRALFITLVTTLLTLNASGTLAIGGKVVMFLLLPVGFWLMETTAKKVQRGYIFVMNRIQKELSLQKEALDECTIITICSRYAFDYNGHNKALLILVYSLYAQCISVFSHYALDNIGIYHDRFFDDTYNDYSYWCWAYDLFEFLVI